MDATVAQPIAVVFAHLTAPARLGDWLVDVGRIEAEASPTLDVGALFALTLRGDGGPLAATGEMIAYEPPWLAAYRLCVGERTYIVRLACSACAGGTRLQIRQGGAHGPLAVDLERLTRALMASGSGGAP